MYLWDLNTKAPLRNGDAVILASFLCSDRKLRQRQAYLFSVHNVNKESTPVFYKNQTNFELSDSHLNFPASCFQTCYK